MPRNFIANDPSNIESSQRWLHIRGVVRPNDTERTMWWNWILILPIKSYRNYPKLLFMRRRRTSGVRTAQRRRKTTTQRREEGQMKSCVSNNVLPIPREIYFSGFAVSTPNFSRFYFTQSPSEKKTSALRLSKRPKGLPHSRKPWESNFFMFVALCFLMDSKARNRKKANFKSSWSRNRIKAGFSRVSRMGHRIEFQIAIPLGISTTRDVSMWRLQLISFNFSDSTNKSSRYVYVIRYPDWNRLSGARKFESFHNFPACEMLPLRNAMKHRSAIRGIRAQPRSVDQLAATWMYARMFDSW